MKIQLFRNDDGELQAIATGVSPEDERTIDALRKFVDGEHRILAFTDSDVTVVWL